MGFSLSAELNLSLAQGAVSRVRQSIQGGLSAIPLDLRLSPSAQAGVERIVRSGTAAGAEQGMVAGAVAAAPGVERAIKLAVQRATYDGFTGAIPAMSRAVREAVTNGIKTATTTTPLPTPTPAPPAGGSAGSFGGAFGRVAAYKQLRSALTGVTGGFEDAVRSAVAWDKEMVRLAQVSEEPRSVIRGLGDEVSRLATGFGLSSADLIKQATTLKQAGFTLRDTKTALAAVAAAGLSPSFDSLSQVSDISIAVKQFGIGADGLKSALGSLNSVSAQFATESSDLAKGIQKAGGAARVAGLSYDELLASMTAVRSTTRESADAIATGLKSIFTQLGRGDTVGKLAALGIQIRYTRQEAEKLGDLRLEGQNKPGFERLRAISQGLSNTPASDPRYGSVIEALGGVRQAGRVIPLLQELPTAEAAVGVAKAGRGSLDVSQEQAQQSIEVRLQKVRERVLALGRDAVDSRGFGGLVSGLERGAVAAEGLARALGPVLPLVGGLAALRLAGAGLGAAGVTQAGVAGAFTGRRLAVGAGVVGAAYLPSLLGSDETSQGAGGAVRGGVAGGLAGSAFGPLGTAVGGVVGALVGFRESLLSTREALQQAGIDKNLIAVGHRLTDLRAGTNPTASAAVEKLLGETRQELERKAASAGTDLLGRLDPAAYSAALAKETRLNLGPRAGELADAAGAQARLLGRRSPDADPAALSRQFLAANKELLRSLASVNGQSPDEVAKTYADVIRSAQSAGRLQPLTDRSEVEGVRAAASLGRLADATDKAVRSVAGLNQYGAALSALDSGAVARPLAPDPTDPATVARLTGGLGSGGTLLRDRFAAGQRLKETLPSALLTAFSGADPLDGEAAGAKVRNLTTAALGGRVNQQEGQALDAVAAALAHLKPEDIQKLAADPTKAAEHLLSSFTAATDAAAGQLAKQVEQRSQVLTDAFGYVASRVRLAGQELDRAAELRLGAVRATQAAELEAVGGGPVNLPLPTLLSPFRARQARLLNGKGLDGLPVGVVQEGVKGVGVVARQVGHRAGPLPVQVRHPGQPEVRQAGPVCLVQPDPEPLPPEVVRVGRGVEHEADRPPVPRVLARVDGPEPGPPGRVRGRGPRLAVPVGDGGRAGQLDGDGVRHGHSWGVVVEGQLRGLGLCVGSGGPDDGSMATNGGRPTG